MARNSGGASFAKSLGAFFVEIGADTSGFQREMAAVQRTLRRAVGPEALQLSHDLTRSFALLTGSIAALGVAAVASAAKLEQQEIAFTQLLKSGEAARAMLEDLRMFALKTPFQFDELVTAAKRIKAFGYAAEEILPILRIVGDASSGLGLDAGGMDRVIRALGQIRSKGKLMAQEMNQLGEAGIGAWQMVADAISKAEGRTVSIAETMKRSETEGISAGFALSAIFQGMSEQFGGMMEKQAKGVAGLFANIIDAVKFVLDEVGKSLTESLRVKEWLASIGDGLTRFVMLVQTAGLKEALKSVIPPEAIITAEMLAGVLTGAMVPALTAMARAAVSAVAGLLPFAGYGLLIAGAFAIMTQGSDELKTALVGLGTAMIWLNREAVITLVASIGTSLVAAARSALGAMTGLATGVTAAGAASVLSAGLIGILAAATYWVSQNADYTAIQILRAWNWLAAGMTKAIGTIKILLLELQAKAVNVALNITVAINKAIQKISETTERISGVQLVPNGLLESMNASVAETAGNAAELEKAMAGVRSEIAASEAEYQRFASIYREMLAETQANKDPAVAQAKMMSDIEKRIEDARKRQDASLQKFLEGLKGAISGGESGTAGGSARKALDDLAEKAKQVHEAIRQEWIQTTQTERQQLDYWYQDEKAKLDESKAANFKYQADLDMLNQTYAKKKADLLEKEAADARKQAAELMQIQQDLAREFADFRQAGVAGATGSGAFLEELKSDADEWLRQWDDALTEWSRRYQEADDDTRAAIRENLARELGEYTINEDGKIQASQRRAELVDQLNKQMLEKWIRYVQSGQALEDELQAAHDAGDLARYMQLLNDKNAAFLSHLEGQREVENVYRELQMEANRSQLSYLAEAYRTMYSSISGAITDLIMGSRSAADILKALGRQMIEMVVNWMAQRKLAAAMSAGLEKAAMASSATTAATLASVWSPVAAMVSLATMGANAAAAAAGITSVTALARTMSAIPAMANGGIVSRPTLALIGEAGPEAVVPLRKGGMGGGAPTVNIYNNTGVNANVRQEARFDGQEWVVNVWLDAFARNKGGLRDALKG